MVHILQPITLGCPRCAAGGVFREGATAMHNCPGMGGLSVPLVPNAEKVRAVVVEREDYVGTEDVQLDENNRPVMAVHHERADGSYDTTVYAPTAHGRVG